MGLGPGLVASAEGLLYIAASTITHHLLEDIMLTIYGGSTYNATKVLFTAEELGVPYEYVHLNFATGEHKSPAHLARHPLGKIPAIDHDGHYLYESASLCRYLANISDKRLYSAEPLGAARIDQMVDMICHHVGRWLAVYFYQEVVMMKYYKKAPDEKAIAEAHGFLEQQLPFVNQTLQDNRFLCGSEITLADTIALPYFHALEATSLKLDAWPAIARWYAELKSRPSFQRALAKMPA
jgi:glutathione S-transferase